MKQDHDEREEERRAFAEYARQSELPPLEDWDGDSLLLCSDRGKNTTSPTLSIHYLAGVSTFASMKRLSLQMLKKVSYTELDLMAM